MAEQLSVLYCFTRKNPQCLFLIFKMLRISGNSQKSIAQELFLKTSDLKSFKALSVTNWNISATQVHLPKEFC